MKKLLLLLGLASVTAVAVAQNGGRAVPSYFDILTRGTSVGSLASLQRPDDNYLMFVPRIQEPIVMEFGAQVPTQSLDGLDSTLSLDVKSFAGVAGVAALEIYMFDWNVGEWKAVWASKTSGISKVNVSVPLAPFASPKDGTTYARLVWTPYSRIKAVGVDSVQWSFGATSPAVNGSKGTVKNGARYSLK